MRVLRAECEVAVPSEVAFTTLFGSRSDVVWLDSGVDATSGMSFVGSAARVATASVARSTVTIDGIESPGSVFDLLRPLGNTDSKTDRLESAGAPLGWIGWLGYELRAETMGAVSTRQSRYPDAGLLFVDRGLLFDHDRGTVEFVALADEWTSDLLEWQRATTAALLAPVSPEPVAVGGPVAVGEPAAVAAATATWRYTDDEYLAMIAECQAAIVEGEAYQLCLTSEASLDIQPDPLATYLALRVSSRSHHGALLRIGDVSLLSSSPEQFLAVSSDGVIESKPIKGTRPRGSTPAADAQLASELEQSEKERAENLMIVDLMRNDIARISEVGSVEVPSLLAVESYAHVHQLVSTVRGRLAPGLDAIDAVRSCFPAGSMTGAPKQRATEILDSLEKRARGIYSGAFGYFAVDGTVDLAMVIRSIVIDSAGVTVGSGGGITALSVPIEELEEVRLKAAALLAVLGA